jgi:putative ABC transport system permease protein
MADRRVPGRADLPFVGTTGLAGMGGISMFSTRNSAGESISLSTVGVSLDLFDFYGIEPLAGTLPRQGELSRPAAQSTHVVLNETAVRKFGLGTAAQAVGQVLPISPPGLQEAPETPVFARVLAVVPDFSLSPVSEAVQPTLYYQPPQPPQLANVRLSGNAIPETLAAIDALWKRAGNIEPPVRRFVSEQMEENYRGVLRESQAFAICALIALALSCIGLFSLTAAAAARRTKEIGVRKALGAGSGHMLRLLIWQFSRPVLWASLIAWPAAFWAMRRWLEGFVYHIDLPLWLFPAATVIAMLVALATVGGHALLVARARPVLALRHQ